MCSGHFKLRKKFRSTSRSRFQFPVETFGFTGTWLVVGHHNNQDLCAQIKGEPCQQHIHSCSTLFDSVLTHWHWDSFLDFIQVQLKLQTQRFLSSELLWESSLRTCRGQLGTLVCNHTVHFRLCIVHSLESNQLTTLLPL